MATRCVRKPAVGFALRRGRPPAHFGQVARSCSIVRSGFGCSVRPTPGRLLRGGRSVAGAGRSGFCPCDGGFEELPGVFGGWVSWLSRASRAAMRASCAAIRWSANANLAVSAAISASFSAWLSAGVGSNGTRRVNSTRALPCQEVFDANCQGYPKRPRLQAGTGLVNRGEQLP